MKKLILISGLLTALSATIHAQEIFDAVKGNDIEEVRILVEKDPQLVNLIDASGRTPLHWAARGVHLDVLKYLIEKGSDVNARDANGTTSLHSTASRGHFEASRLLIEKGAAVNDKNNTGATPFYYVATTGNKELLEYLLLNGASKEDLELRNAYGRTPLCAVARDGGDAETIKVLISLGADVNAEDRNGNTPIMLAAWRPYKDVVTVLLDAGAELNINTPEGEELLAYAADNGIENLFEEMVRRNASLEIMNEDGGTLLHSASGGGSIKIVGSMISSGFDVNGKDKYGWYPIHIAAEQGHKEIIALLIENGADINAINILGETPYNIAQDRQDTLLINYFKSIGADTSAPKFPEIKGKYLGATPPGLNPERFASGIIFHRYKPHSTVAVSPGGDEIFWNPMIISRGGGYSYGYIMTTRLENGMWTYPGKVPFSERDFKDDHPVFSADGNRLYFASKRPIDATSADQAQTRIWFIEKTKYGWSKPKLFELQPMPSAQSEMFFTFSFDRFGNYYFVMGRDIYCADFSNGKYSTPVKLSENINNGELIGGPYISPDGDYLLYYRGKPFISFRNSDGNWTEGVDISGKMGRTLNYSFSGDYIFTGFPGLGWVSSKIIEELRPGE